MGMEFRLDLVVGGEWLVLFVGGGEDWEGVGGVEDGRQGDTYPRMISSSFDTTPSGLKPRSPSFLTRSFIYPETSSLSSILSTTFARCFLMRSLALTVPRARKSGSHALKEVL
jgi:hypothetical protein